ncbi:MAG: single-stranded DNA-binding protein [Lachnospiraceae bacterium]|jgi:single-strand DNA-binding protein|uniref:single-stranded DNA-binding protein n=1 Tax=uncultured Acetatifactor sp. TaxID=1671927 RepID=UPI0026084BBA|nr:single-stranded DNA-binding protein [uncultured Acetatifactor sp.]MCI8789336.1 single-stranded DNA-binding protein [Lachnospiraceae bacterium]
MNKVILMGRLTRDPEVRYSQGASQTAVARFSIAVDRRFGKREGEPDADFFNCTAFGKTAEFVERYLHKGTKIALSGRIQNDNYTNKEGQMVYSVRIIVDDVEFAESKNASGGNAGGYGNGGGYNNGGYAGGGNSAPAPSGTGDGFMNIPDGIDEELPFN